MLALVHLASVAKVSIVKDIFKHMFNFCFVPAFATCRLGPFLVLRRPLVATPLAKKPALSPQVLSPRAHSSKHWRTSSPAFLFTAMVFVLMSL
jgi:hypothetical protein